MKNTGNRGTFLPENVYILWYFLGSIGRSVTWAAVTSTSSDLQVLEMQRGMASSQEGYTLFIIELTSGRAKGVSQLSTFPDEKEVLVPPYTTFETTSGELMQFCKVLMFALIVAPCQHCACQRAASL
jgi:hypothetical protein